MYKVFLFDLGNVLAKPLDDKTLYEKIQCKVPYEEFLQYLYFDEAAVGAHTGEVSDEEHVKSVIRNSGSTISVEEYYEVYYSLDKSLFCDTVALVKKLKNKGYQVGILSNLRFMDYKRHQKELDELPFDYWFLSYEMGCIKPSEEIFQKVIHEVGCLAEEIVFFDDGQKNVDSARALGINAHLVTGNTIKNVFAVHVEKSF